MLRAWASVQTWNGDQRDPEKCTASPGLVDNDFKSCYVKVASILEAVEIMFADGIT